MQKNQQTPPIKDSHTIGDINFQLPILLESEKRVKMRMVGDMFTINYIGKTVKLEVVPDFGCTGCFFQNKFCSRLERKRLAGNCSQSLRWDNTAVLFKEIPIR